MPRVLPGCFPATCSSLNPLASRSTPCCHTTLQVRASLEEGIRDEVEGYRAQLEGVKAELAPWEAQMKEVQVRRSERLMEGQTGSRVRLQQLRPTYPSCALPLDLAAGSAATFQSQHVCLLSVNSCRVFLPAQARIDVAASERDLLTKAHEDAKQRCGEREACMLLPLLLPAAPCRPELVCRCLLISSSTLFPELQVCRCAAVAQGGAGDGAQQGGADQGDGGIGGEAQVGRQMLLLVCSCGS